MLEIRALESGYIRGASVLKGIELFVSTGDRLAVMGRNGMGKTLLMKTIMGLISPNRGTIHFRDTQISDLTPNAISNLGVAYVPQGREIFLDFTVEENLLMGFVGKPWITRPGFEKIFDWFPILAERRNQKAGTMSGGQQQQLAIGRALIGEPDLLLLDEPSEGIQPSIVQEIAETLSNICREQGLTVIVVEQNTDLVKALSQSVAFLENGTIVAQVQTSEIIANPALLEKYMGL
ncbi:MULTISPECIES: ABC transporter ATP-binding protein [Brucella/Ochrobactrum group]|uniref:ABC transporter ATP-binding protein n=1 Tax=Brucella/Ochrobactrum group TaxID=2826938 RepID=UPI000DD5A717|nr:MULTISPECIES: ABC transporter ATP-binding protein [Brucella/Ochrobactrum group]MBR7654721.1 ABC transporter ATP-binding protein [Brucella oryzae]MCQ9148134.1 ABC transporter ATP-binding protein [Ochrobactrum sp. BTU2]